MAIVTKSIGATSRDYATVTSYKADLGNGAIYNAGDDAIGEMYNDATFDEGVVFETAAAIILNSVTLTVPVAERHDGTAGTGVRVVMTADRDWEVVGNDFPWNLEWIEWDWNGNNSAGFFIPFFMHPNTLVFTSTIMNFILHGITNTNGSLHARILGLGTGANSAINGFIYNCSTTANDVAGIYLDSTSADEKVLNVTIFDITNSGAGARDGVKFVADDAMQITKNVIAMDCGTDFNYAGSSNVALHNMSSDPTADDQGSGHLINKTAANQFVSVTGGSEDLHLKAGADALLAGLGPQSDTDIPTDDIDGDTRQGATTDMGADLLSTVPEFVSIGADEFEAPISGGLTGLLDAVPRSRR